MFIPSLSSRKIWPSIISNFSGVSSHLAGNSSPFQALPSRKTRFWKEYPAINRRAKFYTLTPAGKRQLQQEKESWTRMVHAITNVLAATTSDI